GEINAVCHDCDACHRGHARHCERRTVLGIVGRNGAFADYLILPVENLRKVPDDLADDMATFVEPLAAALEIAEQVAIDPRDRVLVIGDGKLGQLVAQALRLRTDSLTVIGRHAEKLRLLAARGIPTMKSGEHYAGRADIVVECTGNPEGLALAIQAVRPRGTIVLKSTYKGQAALDMARLVVDEITLVGSRCGPFPPAIDLLARGAIDPRPIISARFPLDEATVAFEKAVQPGVLKVLIDIQAQEQS
ncbi:MAG: zinc-binding dehydrogenase, partial [Vicinamibacteria bacterium]|nr:zinc-binding dehydrogenase [Vicinamibacteria bacterium]